MRKAIYEKGAVISALFHACLLFTSTTLAADCPPPPTTETVTVSHVHDGDTLRLVDGRKIRLIGIDTPELARDSRPAQPFAMQARDALRALVRQSNQNIRLSYGPQPKDRYGRVLAHLYTLDGQSIQARLLADGLATAFTTPPNATRSQCYRTIESEAIKGKQGIWSLPQYQLKSSQALTLSNTGFHRVVGRLDSIRFTPRGAYLHMNQLRIKIKHNDLIYFTRPQLEKLAGKTIQIRGWLYARKDYLFMSLSHPDALIIE